jgi:hypothetical protein
MTAKGKRVLTLWHHYEMSYLREDGDKYFWNRERRAAKQSIRAELLHEMIEVNNNIPKRVVHQETPKHLQRPQSKPKHNLRS